MIDNEDHKIALRALHALPDEERKALQELFIGQSSAKLSAEEAMTLVDYGIVPGNLTRRVLAAYDRVAELTIEAGQDLAVVRLHGQSLRQQSFRRKLIRKADRLCRR